MEHTTFAAALIAGILTSVPAWAKDPALLSLSAEHFTETASVVEDAQTASISTEAGYVERSGPLGTVWHDEFLKATVDHGTGHRAFQIDVSTTYSGTRRLYKGVRFGPPAATATVPVMLLTTHTVNCAVGDCTYTDQLEIPVDEAMLRLVAQGYAPGRPALWTFRVLATTGQDYQGSLSNAEVAGLLAKVDAYAEHPSAAAPAPAPAAPARLEFGITGLSVSPAPDMPNRAGVLVAGVTPGSVAQKAGIITGDIIFQFDTRSIRELPDLEAAVARAPARSVARIHFYRGTQAQTVEAHF